MALNSSNIKPVPLHQTLVLVNNFILNTSRFLNTFSDTIEKKLVGISNQITELEILLAVVEAKLNSIPDDNPSGSAPPPIPMNQNEPELPINNKTETIPSAAAAPPVVDIPAAPAVDNNMIPASEHPDYIAFLKMIKVGVPPPVVMGKMNAAGLDSSVLDNPNKLVPKP